MPDLIVMRAPPRHDVVLLGIGHTNAHVLRMWRQAPRPGGRLTCVVTQRIATYSGMLPGVLAGQYPREQMEIDLVRLCAAAGAQLVIGEVTGLDRARRALLFRDNVPVPFDVLSIGVGSVPASSDVTISDGTRMVPVKPMQTFLDRFDEHLRQAGDRRPRLPVRIVIVGGGAGGVELALCLPARLRTHLGGGTRFEQSIVTTDERLLPASRPSTARRVERLLRQRRVAVLTGRRVVQVDGGQLTFDDGASLEADLILWLTTATAPPLLADLGLPTDPRGFLLTTDTLQTTAGDPIFAVGDSGTVAGSQTPKAGVFAVRQGPVLWDNIGRMLAAEPLQRYTPQLDFLKLLNTGDGRAIGEWKGLSFESVWAWWLKDFIDRRFVRRYQNYPPPAASGATAAP
ncbi:MAG: FAD-dependent oxidoreductase [Vicinamibacterales bacterium]